ncbi:MAG: hypothetical protein Q4B84_03370 [Clostridia bacterium]|nr:hypothetical protein [Clostridia bacterium]
MADEIHKLNSLKKELDNQVELVKKGPVVPKYVFKIAKQCFLDIKNETEAVNKKLRFGFASKAKETHDGDFDTICKTSIEKFFKISKSFIEFQRENYKRKNDIKKVKELINKIKNKMNDLLNSGTITSEKVINIEELDSSNKGELIFLDEVKQSYKEAEKSLSDFKKKHGKTSLTIRPTSMTNFKNQISDSYKEILGKKLKTMKEISIYYNTKFENANKQGASTDDDNSEIGKLINDLDKNTKSICSIKDMYKEIIIDSYSLPIIKDFYEKCETDTYKELFEGVFNGKKEKLQKAIGYTNKKIDDLFKEVSGTRYASLKKINQNIDKILSKFNDKIMAISKILTNNKEFGKKLSEFCSYSSKNTYEKEKEIKKLYKDIKQDSFCLALYDKSKINNESMKQRSQIKTLGNIREYIEGCIKTTRKYIDAFQNSGSGHSKLLECIDKLNKINIEAINADIKKLSDDNSSGVGIQNNVFDESSFENVKNKYEDIKKILDEIYSEYYKVEEKLDSFKNYNSFKNKIFRTFKKAAQSTVAFINISLSLGRIFAGDYSAAGALLNNARNLYDILKG